MVRTYARIIAIGFVLWAIGALVGLWGQSPGRIVLFLGTSLVFSYAGFRRVNAMDLRIIVGGMGILYLFSATLLIVGWAWLDTPDEPEISKILIRGTIGVVSLLCVKFLPQRDEHRDYHSSEVQPYTTEKTASPEAQAARAESLPEEDHNQDGDEGY